MPIRGGLYTGPLRNGLPHGSDGVMVYTDPSSSGSNYTGEWRFGRKNGRGVMFWRSGDR